MNVFIKYNFELFVWLIVLGWYFDDESFFDVFKIMIVGMVCLVKYCWFFEWGSILRYEMVQRVVFQWFNLVDFDKDVYWYYYYNIFFCKDMIFVNKFLFGKI